MASGPVPGTRAFSGPRQRQPAEADPKRILLAEDATIIRFDLRRLFERLGFEVCGEARDGEEAEELARSLEPAPRDHGRLPRADQGERLRRRVRITRSADGAVDVALQPDDATGV